MGWPKTLYEKIKTKCLAFYSTRVRKLLIKHTPIDLFEPLVDMLATNEFIKSIPVLSSLVAIFNIKRGIPDLLLMQKLESFLNALDLHTEVDIQKMRARLGNEKERQKVGERLLFLLNASTEIEKPALMAKAFTAYIHKKINRQQLDSIWNVLDKCYLDNLKEYIKIENEATIENLIVFPLASLGLFTISDAFYDQAKHYYKTDFGFLVSHILFDTKSPEEYMPQEYDFSEAGKNPYKKRKFIPDSL